jgi:ribosomal protein S5
MLLMSSILVLMRCFNFAGWQVEQTTQAAAVLAHPAHPGVEAGADVLRNVLEAAGAEEIAIA